MSQHCCHHEPTNEHMHGAPTNADDYTCPMHPEIRQNAPGYCPICGMALEPVMPTTHADNAEYLVMRLKFWTAAILSIPVLLLSMGSWQSPYNSWLQWLLSTPVVFWAGWTFFERAWLSLIQKSPNMFTLIALGVGAAYFYSVAATVAPGFFPESFQSEGHLFIYFEASAVITTLVLLGQVLELKAKGQTSMAIRALLNRTPSHAHLIRNGIEIEAPLEEVHVGDILRVKPGEKVPVDGVLIDGTSAVDESMLTGESMPVEKKPSDNISAGTLNLNGSFTMKAGRVGSETLLARIVQMVSQAQRSKAPIQKLADVVSGYFVPAVVVIAFVTFVVWAAVGPEPRFVYALVNAIAVLIVACPCALGLATPMSLMVSIGTAAEHGILIKNGEALERLEKVDTLLIDKTGTLTAGKPEVADLTAAAGFQDEEMLAFAASLEASSEHPLASAVLKMAKKNDLALIPASNFSSVPGGGISGTINGRDVVVGTRQLLKDRGIENFDSLANFVAEADRRAYTVMFVAIDRKLAGGIAVFDPIKETSRQAIDDLHRMGIKIVMATGDLERTAYAVAEQLHIDDVHAGVSPQDKIDLLHELKRKNRIVAMAGDGINDAPALAAADVGIAMGTGTDAAIESAGITLVKGDLSGIVRALALGKETMRNIRQNLFFAFVYNFLGVPIAAGVLYPFFGWLLNPMIASAAMALSSISVILNALRLKR